jgi:hypothetical protein
MQHLTRPLLLAALVVFCAAPAGAQVPAADTATDVKPAGRPDQTIQRIHNQDAGSRIDELRVGGETQSITVQPAANVPAYEIKPIDASRSSSSGAGETGTAGSRFWNILKF